MKQFCFARIHARPRGVPFSYIHGPMSNLTRDLNLESHREFLNKTQMRLDVTLNVRLAHGRDSGTWHYDFSRPL